MNKKLTKLLRESEKKIETYKKQISEAERPFRELNSENMQSVLIQFEDYLDSNHLYAFKNWNEGAIWDGPDVHRHWVNVTLKYPYDLMPDPKGAARLVNSGAIISFRESDEFIPMAVEKINDLDPVTRKPKEEKKKIWLVTMKVPRRFIDNAIEQYDYMDPEKSENSEQNNDNDQSENESLDNDEIDLDNIESQEEEL